MTRGDAGTNAAFYQLVCVFHTAAGASKRQAPLCVPAVQAVGQGGSKGTSQQSRVPARGVCQTPWTGSRASRSYIFLCFTQVKGICQTPWPLAMSQWQQRSSMLHPSKEARETLDSIAIYVDRWLEYTVLKAYDVTQQQDTYSRCCCHFVSFVLF
jgi:hypothetical protein